MGFAARQRSDQYEAWSIEEVDLTMNDPLGVHAERRQSKTPLNPSVLFPAAPYITVFRINFFCPVDLAQNHTELSRVTGSTSLGQHTFHTP